MIERSWRHRGKAKETKKKRGLILEYLLVILVSVATTIVFRILTGW